MSRDLPGVYTATGLKHSSNSGPSPDFSDLSKGPREFMVCGHLRILANISFL